MNNLVTKTQHQDKTKVCQNNNLVTKIQHQDKVKV